jgi:hypothetical protein
MAVIPNSIGVVVEGEFVIKAKADTIGRWLGSDIMSEPTMPSSYIESEKSGSM